jgi:hypothetical protein
MPAYAIHNEWVKVGDKPLRTTGGQHANPVAVDWDEDGLWDLVVGAADGGVYWYRNSGQPAKPAFEPPVALVPKHEGISYNELLEPGEEPRPGIRAQIAVTDYDGDAKLDLLLGDFCTNLHVRNDLTPQERRAFDEARWQGDAATKFLRESIDALRAKFKDQMKGVPPSDWNTPENNRKWQDMYNAMREDPEYKKHREVSENSGRSIQRYVVKAKDRELGVQSDPATSHGYVWLFRRK